MHTHIQHGSTLMKYAIVLVTLTVVLLASCPLGVHAHVLGGSDAASLSKRTLANLNDGRSLSNAERLARGLPLKKPHLARSGKRSCNSESMLDFLADHVGQVDDCAHDSLPLRRPARALRLPAPARHLPPLLLATPASSLAPFR